MSAVITRAASRSTRTGRGVFFGGSALLFAACASTTILWCTSMSHAPGMAMPGGWTMSMVWMRMPGQTWLGAGAAFLGMWTTMMTAMMLPPLAPALWRCVECAGGNTEGGIGGTANRMRAISLGPVVALMGVGYLSVWIVLGIAVFLPGVAVAAFVMKEPEIARAVPIAVGIVVLGAGALQFTRWKAHHLALCRELPCSWRVAFSPEMRSGNDGNVATALKCGLRLGIHCSLCSTGFTAILLVVGLMDLRAMAAVTIAVALERLAPAGERVARAMGAAVLAAGLAALICAV